MKSYPRSRRVSDQMRREASILLDKFLENESFGLVSVTDVSITKDLRHAKIFVSSLGDVESRNEALEFLAQNSKSFRKQLAQRIVIKYMPEISFEFDPSVEQGMRIESILSKIEEKESGSDSETSAEKDSR